MCLCVYWQRVRVCNVLHMHDTVRVEASSVDSDRHSCWCTIFIEFPFRISLRQGNESAGHLVRVRRNIGFYTNENAFGIALSPPHLSLPFSPSTFLGRLSLSLRPCHPFAPTINDCELCSVWVWAAVAHATMNGKAGIVVSLLGMWRTLLECARTR